MSCAKERGRHWPPSLVSANPDYGPSSLALLPRGEKGANHGDPHRHPTVGCNKRSALHRDHMADFPPHPQPFSREGRRGHTTDALAQTRSPFAPCHDPAFSQADTVLRG
ncbi:hypothetical protein KBAH04_26150 [Aeromonas hydrophila]|nr:hypothetical protein KBAH04_26150 [Aeromonas hydrophila]